MTDAPEIIRVPQLDEDGLIPQKFFPDSIKAEPVPAYPVLPTPTQVDAYGESTTNQARFETNLAAYTGLAVTNRGVSGQGVTDELLRMGAIAPRLTLAGGSIPAGAFSVAVTAINPNRGWRINGTGTFGFAGSVLGVPAQLIHDLVNDTFALNGTNAGAAVTVPAGTEFVVTPPTPTRRLLFWTARNNVGKNMLPIAQLATLGPEAQRTQAKEYLILGVLNGTSEGRGTQNYQGITGYNTRMGELHGMLFYDIRRDFIDRGLILRGLRPTAEDAADIAADRPPRSLMEAGGGIHPNADGYLVINYLVAEYLLLIGWVASLNLPAIPPLPPIVDPEPTPTVLASDSFDRANTSAGSIGATDSAAGGTSLTPVVDGQVAILSNQVGAASLSASRAIRWPTGVTNHAIQIAIKASPLGQRLYARYTDTSNYYQALIGADGAITVNRRVGGTTTSIAGAAAGTVASNFAGTFKLSVKTANGETLVRVYLAGALVVSQVDTAPLATGTSVGFGTPSTDATFRMDDLLITDL